VQEVAAKQQTGADLLLVQELDELFTVDAGFGADGDGITEP
jgi:hypothetical protein